MDIKFKALRKDNGEWVEGYYFADDKHYMADRNCYVEREQKDSYTGLALHTYCNVVRDFIEIDPATLSIFINGKWKALGDKADNELMEK